MIPEPRYRVATSIAPAPPPNPGALSRDYFAGQVPVNEQYRPHFGRSLDLDKIDASIRAANMGLMSRITDLSRECISLDGHVLSLLQKRLNRITALEWEVAPATGTGIDEGRAKEYAAQVREQIAMIPNFADRMCDLAWGVFDGRAASEIEWGRDGQRWAVRDLHWIHPRRISFGPNRDLRVIEPERQIGNFYDAGFAVEQVPYKFLTFRPRMFGDYQEREGLAYRSLYWSFFQRLGVRERLELMEIFGKPWRILVPRTGPGMPALNIDALQRGFEALTLLGYHNTARMPANVDVQVVQPEQGAGQVHNDVVADAREVLSKMYLGHVITVDAASTGLGSGVAQSAKSGEDLLVAADARRIAQCIEDKLTDAIIICNEGVQWGSHAPAFKIRTDPPEDRNAEADRIKKALDLGLRVAEEEARQRIGLREVRADEPYIVRMQRPAQLGQVPQPPGPETVYPVGKAPQPGEVLADPDIAINVDEGPLPGVSQLPGAERHMPQLPAGAEDDLDDEADLDDRSDVAELAARMTELGIKQCEHLKRNRCRICGIERDRKVDVAADGTAVWGGGWKPIGAPSPSRRVPDDAPSPMEGDDDLAGEVDDEIDDDEPPSPVTRV